MSEKHPVILSYDIKDNRRRDRVRKALKEWRLEGQKSVNECLLTRTQAQELFQQLRELCDPDEDRLLLAWIAPKRAIIEYGQAHVLGYAHRYYDIQS